LLIWAAAFLARYLDGVPLVLFPASMLSAFLLSRAYARERGLFRAGLGFFLVWSLFRLIMGRYFGEDGSFDPTRLGSYVFLGLHLFFVWTPLEIARATRGILGYLVGRRLSAIAAVSVFTLARAIPWILEDAVMLKKSLALRVPGLPFRRRAALWGQALVTLTFRRAGDLGRALVQRQGSITGEP
jgi:hypothetical protein